MAGVSVGPEGFVVDAELLARAFALDPATVRERMRNGDITSLSETGTGDDQGRFRLTFYHGGRALRLTVDGSGTVISQATFSAHPPRPRR